MSAPTSSITLNPWGLAEGYSTAIAGRFTPGNLRKRIIDIAISAPVLPHDTATAASPVRTDSMADHIDVPWPVRTTWLGLSSMETTSAAWRISHRPRRGACLATKASNCALSPCKTKEICGLILADKEHPATIAAGPSSPPMASTDNRVCPFAPGAGFALE